MYFQAGYRETIYELCRLHKKRYTLEAKTVFYDEEALLIFDPENSEKEDRFLLLGRSSVLRLLIVCHCYRGQDEEVIRIISARKANSLEQKQYIQRGSK
ncbi:MAG: BrnT family toxin [Spirochaetales bacterium]|nr:BrnT family toxin [Spirochaetales bacterium]